MPRPIPRPSRPKPVLGAIMHQHGRWLSACGPAQATHPTPVDAMLWLNTMLPTRQPVVLALTPRLPTPIRDHFADLAHVTLVEPSATSAVIGDYLCELGLPARHPTPPPPARTPTIISHDDVWVAVDGSAMAGKGVSTPAGRERAAASKKNVRPKVFSAYSVVSSNGTYRFGHQAGNIAAAERRALQLAIRVNHHKASHGRHVTIMSDSRAAVRLANETYLNGFDQQVRKRYSIIWVKGHSGLLLNEIADSIARKYLFVLRTGRSQHFEHDVRELMRPVLRARRDPDVDWSTALLTDYLPADHDEPQPKNRRP